MKIGYDPDKNAKNIKDRGLSFDDVIFLDWDDAVVLEDTRKDYCETRLMAFVRDVDSLPYVVIYTIREDTRWIISFRRAHEKERRKYDA